MAQKQRKPQPKAATNLKPFYWVLGLVGLLGVGWIAKSTMTKAEATQEPIVLSPEVLKNTQQLMAKAQGVKVGADNAPDPHPGVQRFHVPGLQTVCNRS